MYRGAEAAVNPRVLPIEPVRHLDQEGVERVRVEQIAQVAAEGARALRPNHVLAALRPYQEDRRAGLVLPAQHRVGVELLEVEPAGMVGDRGVEVRRVAV